MDKVKQRNYFKGCTLPYERANRKRLNDERLADKAEIERLKKKCGEI